MYIYILKFQHICFLVPPITRKNTSSTYF